LKHHNVKLFYKPMPKLTKNQVKLVFFTGFDFTRK